MDVGAGLAGPAMASWGADHAAGPAGQWASWSGLKLMELRRPPTALRRPAPLLGQAGECKTNFIIFNHCGSGIVIIG